MLYLRIGTGYELYLRICTGCVLYIRMGTGCTLYSAPKGGWGCLEIQDDLIRYTSVQVQAVCYCVPRNRYRLVIYIRIATGCVGHT